MDCQDTRFLFSFSRPRVLILVVIVRPGACTHVQSRTRKLRQSRSVKKECLTESRDYVTFSLFSLCSTPTFL